MGPRSRAFPQVFMKTSNQHIKHSLHDKVAQNEIITHINFFSKTIDATHANFLLKIQHGLKINVAQINSHDRN